MAESGQLSDHGSTQVMPFHQYSSYFQPEELDRLAAAYNAAWQELSPESFGLAPDSVRLLRKNLAQIILASACTGKRDVERLKEIAVRGLAGRMATALNGPLKSAA